jgi:hypothetical protein
VFVTFAAAAFLPYAIYGVVSYQSDAPWTALFLADSRGFSYVIPDPVAWTGRAVLWLATAVVLCAVVVGAKKTRVIGLWIISLSAAVTILGGSRVVPIASADHGQCLDGQPTVCTDVAHAFALPSYAAAAHEAVMALPADVRPTVVAQNTRARDAAPPGGLAMILEPVSGFTQPAQTVDRETFLSDFGERLFKPAQCLKQEGSQSGAMRDALVIWWRQRFGLPLDGSSSVASTNYEYDYFETALSQAKEFAALDATVRDGWLSTNLEDLLTCREVPSALP